MSMNNATAAYQAKAIKAVKKLCKDNNSLPVLNEGYEYTFRMERKGVFSCSVVSVHEESKHFEATVYANIVQMLLKDIQVDAGRQRQLFDMKEVEEIVVKQYELKFEGGNNE